MKNHCSIRLFSALAIMMIVAACNSAPQGSASAQQNSQPVTPDKVRWRDWNPETLAQAQAGHKLVFMYFTTPWCLPCTEMEFGAFADDSIAKILNDDYFPIRVDADRYPSVFERYGLGGYPSCMILSPDLRVVGGALSSPADSLQLLLERVHDSWQDTPFIVQQQAAFLDSTFRDLATKAQPQRPSDEFLTRTEGVIYHRYDSTYGGFGNQPKLPLPMVNKFLFAATTPGGALLFKGEIAQTLAAQLKLLDPVWGGFYRSANFADWSAPSHEKLLADNARLLSNYAEAYLLTRDSSYRSVIETTADYMLTFLKSGRGWGLYNSQAGLVIRGGVPSDPASYFSQNDAARRALGMPATETEIYTSANSLAISALLQAGRILHKRELVDFAIVTLDSLSKQAMTKDGLVRHNVLNPFEHDPLLLEDQVAMTTALIDAYETTGERKYLLGAQGMAQTSFRHFADPAGGLWIDNSGKDAPGRMGVPFKPIDQNAAAVVNYVRLYYLTADESFKRPAERTIMYIFSVPFRKDDLRIVMLADAYVNITRYPTKFALVGPSGAEFDKLREAVFGKHLSRYTLAYLGDGSAEAKYGGLTFAPVSRAQLYVCGDDTLSRPIENADSLAAVLKEFQISLLQKK